MSLQFCHEKSFFETYNYTIEFNAKFHYKDSPSQHEKIPML